MSEEGIPSSPEHKPIFSPLEVLGEVVLEGGGFYALATHLSISAPNVLLWPAGLVMMGSGIIYGIYKVVRFHETK